MRSGLGPQVSFRMGMGIAATNEIQIAVNGQVRQAPRGQTLLTLLRWLDVDPGRVAVELNGSIVRRQEWEITGVDAGAALEIVQFVGGG
jgi:sulfur carrier protein